MVHQAFLKLLGRARFGDVKAQLLVGKIFLNGGYGQGPNPRIAFLWLSRAAKKNNIEAQVLIGSVFPPSFAQQLTTVSFLRVCYQAAADAGVEQAKVWLHLLSSTKKVHQMLPPYFTAFKQVYEQALVKRVASTISAQLAAYHI